jgi:hypothetical protein
MVDVDVALLLVVGLVVAIEVLVEIALLVGLVVLLVLVLLVVAVDEVVTVAGQHFLCASRELLRAEFAAVSQAVDVRFARGSPMLHSWGGRGGRGRGVCQNLECRDLWLD